MITKFILKQHTPFHGKSLTDPNNIYILRRNHFETTPSRDGVRRLSLICLLSMPRTFRGPSALLHSASGSSLLLPALPVVALDQLLGLAADLPLVPLPGTEDLSTFLRLIAGRRFHLRSRWVLSTYLDSGPDCLARFRSRSLAVEPLLQAAGYHYQVLPTAHLERALALHPH